MDLYPFQEIPGLLTPEMSSNVRTNALMSAAAALMKSGAWSTMPVSPFAQLGQGLEGLLSGYQKGGDDVLKQVLTREQIQKAQDERAQRDNWMRVMGLVPGGGAPAPGSTVAPSAPRPQAMPTPAAPAPVSMPAGILSPEPMATQNPAAMMQPATASTGVLPTAPASAPDMAPGLRPGPSITKRDIRQSAEGGISQVLRDMPPALRQVIGLQGPKEGAGTLAGWIGKVGDKPSDTFLTVEMPDGKRTSFRADDPQVDRAVASGGKLITTQSATTDLKTVIMPNGARRTFSADDPKLREAISNGAVDLAAKPAEGMVTIERSNGSRQTYRADDPQVDREIQSGAKQISTPSANASLKTVEFPDGRRQTFAEDDPALRRAVSSGALEVTTKPSDRNSTMYLMKGRDGQSNIVRSFDGGKTYLAPDGTYKQLPAENAVEISNDTAFETLRQAQVANKANKTLENGTGAPVRQPAESAAMKGTGPWSNVQAAINAVAGGLGLDKAFGKEGMFVENEANRDYLRKLNQLAKPALMNNPRNPVSEQEIVERFLPNPDSLWANPRTEWIKIPQLRDVLRERLKANNEALADGSLRPEEVSKLQQNNIETKRVLEMMGEGPGATDQLGNVVKPKAQQQPAAATMVPKVGDVRKGYKFLGGNPADPKSWEKAQ